MRLTDTQLAERAGKITASLAPAILGCCDDFCSPFEAYQRIVGEAPAFAGNAEAADLGHVLEPVVAEMWRQVQIGPLWELEAVNDTLWHPDHGWLGATLDYLAHDPLTGERRIVEIKTTGSRSLWGDDDTADVPEKVKVQVAVQRLCSGGEDGTIHGDPAHVAVLFTDGVGKLLRELVEDEGVDGWPSTWHDLAQRLLRTMPERFRHYTLPRDRAYEQHVLERLRAFYEQHVVPRIPPAAPDAGTFLEPDDRQAILLRRMAEIARDKKALESEATRIKNALQVECRGYGGFQLGECRVPWVTQKAGEVRYMREAGEYLQFRSLGKLLKADADEQPIW